MGCRRVWKSLLLVGVYLGYLVLGAFVFQMLEKDAEDTAKSNTVSHRLAFLKNYTCLTEDAMDQLINVITDAVKQGINPLNNVNITTETKWDISSSFFFAGTVVTTIGYGTLAPRTPWGQIFCVWYALFGIPFNVIFLGQVGKALSLWCEKLWKYLFSKGMEKKKAKIWTIVFFLAAGIIIFLGLPPFIFTITEGWSYQEGFYYAFISLSTIGFGDYVAGYGPNTKQLFKSYRAFLFIWIIFGLAWIALLFNLLTSLLEDTEKKIARDLQKKGKKRKSNQEISLLPSTSGHGVEKEETMAMVISQDKKAKHRDDTNEILDL
ncbi:potassium channel, subfamily K, member 16-like [Discoglossus pictus]